MTCPSRNSQDAISRPSRCPREVAYFVPDAPRGFERPSSNDVFLTREGLIYLVDRQRGMHILERI
jgi:hypothetical protein